MTWSANITISRKNEVIYHNLNLSDKKDYLVHKYFTPQNWLDLYMAYQPNYKEFLNNAFWRLNSDIFLDHFYQGVTEPFVREPVYAVASLFPMVTATTFKLSIGGSNNTYTGAHLTYTALRAAGKFSPYIIYYEQRNDKGALDQPVKVAQYLTDTICRWVPYSNERLQTDKTTDVYSSGFIAISIISGIARTKGSEIANKPAKLFQDLATNILTNIISDPFGINVEGTTLSKMIALKDTLIGKSVSEGNSLNIFPKISTTFNIVTAYTASVLAIGCTIKENVVDKASYVKPIFDVSYEYGTTILSTTIYPIVSVYSKTTEASLAAVSYVVSPILGKLAPYVPKMFLKPEGQKISLEKASEKGAILLAGAIVFDIVKFMATNFAASMALIPCSRIIGVFAEEATEFSNELTDLLMGKMKSEYIAYSGKTDAFAESNEL